MWIVVVRHTEMAKQLTGLQATMFSAAQPMLGRSPTEAFQVDIVDELFAEFWM
jgi:hypothetical protein